MNWYLVFSLLYLKNCMGVILKMKIKDPIALGALTGLLGSIPHLLVNFLSVQLGFSRYYSFQISAGIFIAEELTTERLGLLIGAISWSITAIILGTLLVLLVKFTGKNHWWLKGILITGGLTYAGIYGILFSLGGANLVPTDIPTTVTNMFGNLVFGISSGYLIIKLGDINNNRISK